MSDSLKQKTISGMLWNLVERFGTSFFLFISNLVLARLLSPDDFGCIGMLLVFISISDAIVDGGFGGALIQKKNPTNTDYSTIFYWNLILSVTFYVILYLVAPFIGHFYKMPLLSDILRIQGFILIINAFTLVQQNILKKQIAFKKIAKINLSSVIIGTCVGVLFAYLGFGVWSLVIKTLVTGLVQCVMYWINNNWMPQWTFSWESLRSLFKFGSFLLMNSIILNFYVNMIAIIIGRYLSSATLGYYIQANKLEEMPRSTLSTVVTNVIFPALSKIQDDKQKLMTVAKKCLSSVVYINTPLMILLIIIAEPLITLLFTDKWAPSIPIFQLICFSGLILTPIEVNLRFIISLGKSKTAFYSTIVQCILAIMFILYGLKWDIYGMLIGFMFSRYVTFAIIAICSGNLFNYGLMAQIKDFIPIFLLSILVGALVYFPVKIFFSLSFVYLLIYQTIFFISLYILFSFRMNLLALKIYSQIIKDRWR